MKKEGVVCHRALPSGMFMACIGSTCALWSNESGAFGSCVDNPSRTRSNPAYRDPEVPETSLPPLPNLVRKEG